MHDNDAFHSIFNITHSILCAVAGCEPWTAGSGDQYSCSFPFIIIESQSLVPKTEAVTWMRQRRQWPSLNHVENFWLLFLRLTCISSDRCVRGTCIDDAHHATWLCSNLNITLASKLSMQPSIHSCAHQHRRVRVACVHCNGFQYSTLRNCYAIYV